MRPEQHDPSRLTDRIATDMSRRLVDRLAADRDQRRIWPSRVLVRLLASVVHLTTVGLLVGGVWLLVTGDTWPLRTLGGLGVVTAVALVPRLPPRPGGVAMVDRAHAPELFALLEEVATTVDSPALDAVGFYPDFNAAALTCRRNRRVLVLGAPAWVACSPQAKVALLAHELGHFANGDGRQDRYVGSAVHAVAFWIDVFDPREPLLSNGFVSNAMVRIVTWPVRMVLAGFLHLIWLADRPGHRRQEHYADLASVLAAGSEGAVDLLETLLAGVAIEVVCDRAASARGEGSMRSEIAAHMATYDADARRRNRQRAAAERVRIDDSHPPTAERLRLVESVGAHPTAAVVLDADRAAQLDAELGKALDAELARYADIRRGW